jgi:hypothetical protein
VHSSRNNSTDARRETRHSKIKPKDDPFPSQPSSLEGRDELGVCNESEPEPEFEIEKKVHFKHPLPIGIYLYGNKQQKDSAI